MSQQWACRHSEKGRQVAKERLGEAPKRPEVFLPPIRLNKIKPHTMKGKQLAEQLDGKELSEEGEFGV